ncbi:MAG TPA: sirohydrochlorin cobaltochelatase [Desulfobacteraceae bacterium]|nr:sirohydrochlorin cobaltochelatase [Desulfobacteraceae bacterium]
MKLTSFFIAVALVITITATQSFASGNYHVEHKSAVVLAMFGTTVEPALQGLLKIQKQIRQQFPGTEVKIAFTSNIIRKKWQRRAEDPEYIKAHPEIPKAVLHVKTPLATIADLQNDGYDNIVIQPTHVSMGEEFLDLHTYVKALMEMGTFKKPKYKPFQKVALGRPAMGTYGTKFPYTDDIAALAKAMAPDAELAGRENAGIVYMGHGNAFFPGNGGAYLEFAAKMREVYPGVVTTIGTVEGYPGIDHVMEDLRLRGVKKVVLKPFMVVAGDHSLNDMASDEEDSWKTILTKNGFDVIPVTQGLGDNPDFARIFVDHAVDAAKEAGIELK